MKRSLVYLFNRLSLASTRFHLKLLTHPQVRKQSYHETLVAFRFFRWSADFKKWCYSKMMVDKYRQLSVMQERIRLDHFKTLGDKPLHPKPNKLLEKLARELWAWRVS
jgi:hypothetical protein